MAIFRVQIDAGDPVQVDAGSAREAVFRAAGARYPDEARILVERASATTPEGARHRIYDGADHSRTIGHATAVALS